MQQQPLPQQQQPPAHRIPRIIDSGWEDDDKHNGGILSEHTDEKERTKNDEEIEPVERIAPEEGEYPQFTPGQYHEVNPGQYHEVNPGQYHEVNPGQYHEVNPGQYQPDMYEKPASSSSGDQLGEVEVEVEEAGEGRRVYNVQSKVDDFIIGEFGTLSERNGETLQGVRYTVVADTPGVDSQLIYDTLHKFFKFS